MASIELFHFWDSFCSFKVRICLAEKDLPWTGRHIDLMRFENLKPEYLTINPKGLVPTLRHEGSLVFESSVINEFIDDKYCEPPLKPADPLQRARMRYWVKVEEDELFAAVRPASLNLMMKQIFVRYTESDLDRLLSTHPRPHQIPLLKKMFLSPPDPKAVDQSRRMLRSTFARMNKALEKGGPWLAGQTYSLADIAAAPVIDRVERLGMADVWRDLPAVKDWLTALVGRPAYIAASPPEEFRMPKPANI